MIEEIAGKSSNWAETTLEWAAEGQSTGSSAIEVTAESPDAGEPLAAPDAESVAIKVNGADGELAADTRLDTALDLAARTLSGDLRDHILDRMRELRDPWHRLTENRQSAIAAEVHDFADSLVTSAVNLLSARDFPAVAAVLGEVKFGEKGCDLKLGLSRLTRDARHAIVDARGSQIMLVIADPSEFSGARGPARIDRQALFDAPPREPDEPIGDVMGPVEVDAAGGEIDGETAAEYAENIPENIREGEVLPALNGEIRDPPDVSDASEAARQYFRSLGRNAALRGEPLSSNPFEARQRARKSWADGWKGAIDAAHQLAVSDAAAAVLNGGAAVS